MAENIIDWLVLQGRSLQPFKALSFILHVLDNLQLVAFSSDHYWCIRVRSNLLLYALSFVLVKLDTCWKMDGNF